MTGDNFVPDKTSRPWRKFYPNDYMGDQDLARCSFGAQGLWARLMCVAWLSPREGFVVRSDGTAVTPDDVADGYLLSKDTPGQVRRYMAELVQNQVCSIEDGTGAIISRRIVRDAARAAAARANGKKGGNPALLADKAGSVDCLDKGWDKGMDKGGTQPPSSSSSTSPSSCSSGSKGESEGETGPSFLAFWQAYPARLRTKQNECIAAWSDCMVEGHDPTMIICRATEYAESPQGRSGFAVRAPRFLEARMFLDPPEAWQDSPDGPQKPKRDYKAMFAEDGR